MIGLDGVQKNATEKDHGGHEAGGLPGAQKSNALNALPSLPAAKRKKIVIGVAIAAALALLVLALNPGAPEEFWGLVSAGTEKHGNQLVLQRASYSLSPAVFSQLPPPPTDFNRIVSLYRDGKFGDESFFTEKYYLQPEFYPSYLKSGLGYWTSPSTTHWGASGFGSYPVYDSFEVRRGGKASAKFFMHSGYGVRARQAISLKATVVEKEGSGSLRAGVRDPVFMLGPNFPSFSRNWARDVVVEVEASSGTPAGEYYIKVYAGRPDKESLESLGEGIGDYSHGLMTAADRPVFEARVVVT